MGDYCRQRMQEFRSKGLHVQSAIILEPPRKKFRSDLDDVSTLRSIFIRSNYSNDSELPKTVLLRHSQKAKNAPPKYETRNVNKLFQSTVTYDGKKYGSSYWYVPGCAFKKIIVLKVCKYYFLCMVGEEEEGNKYGYDTEDVDL